MTQRAPGRKSALIALTAVALLALGAMAPVASAQVSTPQIPGTETVTDTVTDTTGTVTDTVSGGTGDSGGGDTVGSVTDTVTDTTTGTTDTATDGAGTIVDSTPQPVQDTADQTKKTVDNTTSQTGTTANTTINDAGDLGGNVTNPLLNAQDTQVKDTDGDGVISKRERYLGGSPSGKKAAYRGELSGDRAFRKAADRSKFGSLAAAERKNRNAISSTPAFAVAPPREGFLAQAAELATEAVEKLAFPLGLALMVGAFLMLQGRFDRKDAKLVLAPIDSEQDLLSFQ